MTWVLFWNTAPKAARKQLTRLLRWLLLGYRAKLKTIKEDKT